MINIRKINEELERILEEENEISIKCLKLVPHGEKSAKYYLQAAEYLNNHVEKVEKGFINIPLSELGIHDNNNQNLGYKFK